MPVFISCKAAEISLDRNVVQSKGRGKGEKDRSCPRSRLLHEYSGDTSVNADKSDTSGIEHFVPGDARAFIPFLILSNDIPHRMSQWAKP